MGKRHLRSVENLLLRVFEHLIPVWAVPHAPDALHWLIEVQTFQAELRKRFRPSMRARINLDYAWSDSTAAAQGLLQSYDMEQAAIDVRLALAGRVCPFTLELLVSSGFLAKDMPALIERSVCAPS